jgi:hypothetical protein
MLDAAVQEIQKGNYLYIVTTGRQMTFRPQAGRSEIESYAENCKRALCERGIDPEIIFAVPASAQKNHKTYKAACEVKGWLKQKKINSVNIFTGGPHGRKTYHIYKRTLGEDINVGIISCKIEHYDPVYWWTSSRGLKVTLKFLAGYFYALIWKF